MVFTDTYIDRVAQAIAEKVNDPSPTGDDARLYRIYALLAMTVGRDVTLEHVHDAWSVWRCDTFPEHRSIVPFDELSQDVQDMDEPYAAAIAAVAREAGD